MPAGEARGGRPWGPIKATTPEARRLAVFLRERVDQSGLSLAEIAQASAGVGRATGVSKGTVGKYLSGAVPREKFVVMLVTVTVADPRRRERLLADANALLHAAEHPAARPTGETAGRDILLELAVARERQLEVSERLTRALEQRAVLERERGNSAALTMLLLAVVDRLEGRVTQLTAERDQLKVQQVDLREIERSRVRLARAQVQEAQARAELQRARDQQRQAEEITARVEQRARALQDELNRLRSDRSARTEAVAEPLPGPPVGWEDDTEDADIAQTLNRAGGINDISGDTLRRVAREVARDIAEEGGESPAPTLSGVVRGQPRTIPLAGPLQDTALAVDEANRAREQLALIYEAGSRIGTTLDLRRTAEELIEVVTPRFADFATVDLLDSILHGEDPALPADYKLISLRAVAAGGVDCDELTSAADAVGEVSRFDSAKVYVQALRSGRSVLIPEVNEATLSHIVTSPERVGPGVAAGVHSYLMIPLLARGVVLGGVEFIRTRISQSFNDADVALAEELVARAAITMDNTRLYNRERMIATNWADPRPGNEQ